VHRILKTSYFILAVKLCSYNLTNTVILLLIMACGHVLLKFLFADLV
jgi:hypothetical protein